LAVTAKFSQDNFCIHSEGTKPSEAAMNQTQWKHLEAHPQSSYKQLFLKGTRLRAEIIYDEMEYGEPDDPMTPEKIAAYRNLPVEAVREAIAYCESDPPEIEEDHRSDREHMQALGVIDAEGNYLRGDLPRQSPQRPSEK
jgi:uncharacterized protein (DUF433 family)